MAEIPGVGENGPPEIYRLILFFFENFDRFFTHFLINVFERFCPKTRCFISTIFNVFAQKRTVRD